MRKKLVIFLTFWFTVTSGDETWIGEIKIFFRLVIMQIMYKRRLTFWATSSYTYNCCDVLFSFRDIHKNICDTFYLDARFMYGYDYIIHVLVTRCVYTSFVSICKDRERGKNTFYFCSSSSIRVYIYSTTIYDIYQ